MLTIKIPKIGHVEIIVCLAIEVLHLKSKLLIFLFPFRLVPDKFGYFLTSWGRTTEMFSQRAMETSLGVSFKTCLRRRLDEPM